MYGDPHGDEDRKGRVIKGLHLRAHGTYFLPQRFWDVQPRGGGSRGSTGRPYGDGRRGHVDEAVGPELGGRLSGGEWTQ